MIGRFAQFVAVDWSGAKGPRQKGIAVALANAAGAPPALLPPPDPRGWARSEVLALLAELKVPTLVGLDLGISLPHADAGAFFPGWDASPADARALWALIDALCASDPHLEAGGFLAHPEAARYFRHGKGEQGDRFLLPGAPTREGRFRIAEHAQRGQGVRPVSNFNLVGAAQVGKSSLTGMRVLHRLAGRVPIWPFDPVPETGPVLVEIYTTIAARAAGLGRRSPGPARGAPSGWPACAAHRCPGRTGAAAAGGPGATVRGASGRSSSSRPRSSRERRRCGRRRATAAGRPAWPRVR